ncbi:IS5 family transposase [Corallococcus sp. AB038B]|nr:IS5 family transposase [Corallococcus sp. AB038B]
MGRPGASGRRRRKRGIRSNALGRSRGGFSTKVHAVTTTGGKPLHVALTPGQQHESTMAEELLVHAEGAAFIADTGYDADRIRANVRKLRMKPVIHSNPSRKRALPLDRTLYRLRYRVECFFHDLNRFRAVATRYDKTATSYLSVLHVASMLLWLR